MDLIDSVIHEIFHPAETSEASATQQSVAIRQARSPIPSAARRGGETSREAKSILPSSLPHHSASEPRTSATDVATTMCPARSSTLSGESRGAETTKDTSSSGLASPLHPSRESGADQANGGSITGARAPDLQPSPATGADEADLHASTKAGAPRQQKSGSGRGKKAIPHAVAKLPPPSSHQPGSDAGSVSGHPLPVTLRGDAADANDPVTDGACDGHRFSDDRPHPAVAGEEPRRSPLDGASPEIMSIWADWRTRQRWHKAEKSLTLQSKAYCRGWVEDGDKDKAGKLYAAYEAGEPVDTALAALLSPYTAAIRMFEEQRSGIEKSLRKTARKLPIYPWIKDVYGASDMTLAAIVGEAGNIGAYKSVAAVWKRLGLAVFEGNRQGNTAGADDKAKEFVKHGYSPARRSVVWNIGNGLIGGMGRGPRLSPGEDPNAREDLSPYQRLFVERCRYEAERDHAHRRPDTIKKDTGEVRESFSKHAASRAKRYVEKRFIRDLYATWRAAEGHSFDENPRGRALGGETPA